MFKRQTEFPPEPKLITSKQICEDLAVDKHDPLYTDAVKEIIGISNSTDSGVKGDSCNPKSFELIDKILKAKEDMISKKNTLTKEIDSMCVLTSDLKEVQERIEKIDYRQEMV